MKCVVANREEAGGTSGVEQDGRRAFVSSGTAGKATRGGCGRRDAGDRIVDPRVDGEMRLLLWPWVDTRLRADGGADVLCGGGQGV